jgi:hypothetical protein
LCIVYRAGAEGVFMTLANLSLNRGRANSRNGIDKRANRRSLDRGGKNPKRREEKSGAAGFACI